MIYVATYSTGAQHNAELLYHAVPAVEGFNGTVSRIWVKSICGYQPGIRSDGWSTFVAEKVPCGECLRRMAKVHVEINERIVE